MVSDIPVAAEIRLVAKNKEGQNISACFLPDKGMNLTSLKKGEIEVIDQTTRPLFEERYAGLGALIGPHFHHRKKEAIPCIKNEELFPHIAKLKAKGVAEPFSHGIGRYAPWIVESTSENSLKATLTGDQLWKGVALKDLEGQNFKMEYVANLLPEGLEINFSVSSDSASIVGLHTYYALEKGKGTVYCSVQEHYRMNEELKPIPSTWNFSKNQLIYPIEEDADFGFYPFPDLSLGIITLKCETHSVRVQYFSPDEENSFQIYHPKGASFVCIEPLSAKNPRQPKLSTSHIKILISIL